MVRSSSEFGKLGGPSGWWDTIIKYGLQLMLYLVYFIVLPTQTAQPLLPTTTTTITIIDKWIVDYDRLITGSFIFELLR